MKSKRILVILLLIIFVGSLLPQNSFQIYFLETVVYKYFALIMVFIYSPAILIVGYLKKTRELKKEAISN